ncbi:hypothetical protein [Pedobacter sp. N23S346]
MLINAVTISNFVATIFEINAYIVFLATATGTMMFVLPMKKDIE